MAPESNIGLHLVRHRKRTTEKVATLHQEIRLAKMPLPRASPIRRAPGGEVQPTNRRKGKSEKKRAGRLENAPHTKTTRDEKEGASRARERERERRDGGFLLSDLRISYSRSNTCSFCPGGPTASICDQFYPCCFRSCYA